MYIDTDKIFTMTTYNTAGTCSRAINYEVADGAVTKCEFVGGCPGQLARALEAERA